MSGDSDEHQGIDAWIFLSIADEYGKSTSEYGDPLASVMEDADWRQRAVPSRAQFEHAVRDLSAAGLIRADGVHFVLTDSGLSLWKRAQAAGSTAHPQFVYTRDFMETVPCVADAGGWSLEDARWEEAAASYSPQFALDLKRREDVLRDGSRLSSDIQEQMLKALASPRRAKFLVTLAYSLGFSSRSNYTSDASLQRRLDAFRVHNELLIVVVAQLARMLTDPQAGYTDEAFVAALNEKGATVMLSLIWCVSRALNLMSAEGGP